MRSNRHVAIFTTSLRTGGAERVAVNISQGLAERSYDVDLLLVNAQGRLRAEVHPDVNVVDLAAGRVLTSIHKLTLYLRRQTPDVLYSMMPHNNTAAYLAHRISGSSAYFVPSEHNMPTSDISDLKDVLLLCASIPVHAYADHSIAVSEGVRDEIARIARINHDDISVVHNPVVTKSLRRQARKHPSHPWFDEAITVVSTGRHVEQKGFDTLIEAFASVRNRTDEDVRLLLFGEGPETERYKNIAADRGIAEHVAFPGFMDNIFAQMAAADVFVLSSRWEGFGNVLVEAMACGTQVVATDCQSGPAEILAEGAYGPLVDVDDSNALADAILAQIETTSQYPVSERSRDFTVSAAAERYVEIFERINKH